MKVNILNQTPASRPASSMKIGEIGRIIESKDAGEFLNQIVLRTYGSIVSLSDPNNTWTPPLPPFPVEISPKGTKIELITE